MCCFAAGCSDRLPTYPVLGRVVFPDGSPVHTGTIELKSREHPIQARGDIAHDGSFRLTTYVENDGAVEGKHDCVVVQFVVVEEIPNFQPSYEGVVHPKFASYSTSRLECEVLPSGKNQLTIQVEPFRQSSNADSRADHRHSEHINPDEDLSRQN
jgi:hypothetical protein